MGANTTKEARLKAELSQFAAKYGVIPLQSVIGTKFKIRFGDFDFYGRGPTENLAKERALAKALKYLNSIPIPDKPEYEEFHELLTKHGLTPLCAIEGNNVILKMGMFIAGGEGPVQRVALQRAVSEAVKYLTACGNQQSSPTSDNQEYLEMAEEHRLTFLHSKICNDANTGEKSELSEFAEKYGVIPMQSVIGNKFKVTFGDFDYYGRGPTESLAKKRAIAKALVHLNSVPVPEKPEYAEFHELALKFGLTTLCSLVGNNAKIKLGNFIFADEGPTQSVAVQRAVSKALKYLRICQNKQTTPAFDNLEFFELREEHRLTFLSSVISGNISGKINLGDFIAKTQSPPTSDTTGLVDPNPNVLVNNEGTAGSAPEPKDSETSKNSDRNSNTVLSSPAKDSEIEGLILPTENENTTCPTMCDKSTQDPEPSIPSVVGKEPTIAGLVGDTISTSDANNSTEEMGDANLTAATQEQTSSRGESLLEDDPTTLEAIICVPVDQHITGEEMKEFLALRHPDQISDPNITEIIHVDNTNNLPPGINQKGQPTNPPGEQTHAYALMVRARVRFPKKLQLTEKEKEGILKEAVKDLIQEYLSPQLLKEAALKPDAEFLNTLTKKMVHAYNILARQKLSEG